MLDVDELKERLNVKYTHIVFMLFSSPHRPSTPAFPLFHYVADPPPRAFLLLGFDSLGTWSWTNLILLSVPQRLPHPCLLPVPKKLINAHCQEMDLLLPGRTVAPAPLGRNLMAQGANRRPPR